MSLLHFGHLLLAHAKLESFTLLTLRSSRSRASPEPEVTKRRRRIPKFFECVVTSARSQTADGRLLAERNEGRFQTLDRTGTPKVVALPTGNADLLQGKELGGGFDTFGNDAGSGIA